MGFWDDSELRLEIKRLKQENDELKKNLEDFEIKSSLNAAQNKVKWFVYNNSKLDNIRVGTRLVCVDQRAGLRTEDGRPYNRVVAMVDGKYTILKDSYNPVDMRLFDNIEAIIKYVKENNYVLCEY
jgi:hypothetical protein